jgi:hypothetical protein
MAQPRSKPDFTAGVVLADEARHCRALELRVQSGNLYAMQPRREKSVKSSYHASGQFHFKIGGSAPITPTIELPPRFIKESAFRLGPERRCLFAISLENAPTLLQYTGQPYDQRIDLTLPKVDPTRLRRFLPARHPIWRQGYDWRTEPRPNLKVVGRRFTQRCKNWRVHTILQRIIQKLIIPAHQRRPKSLQMTGFEFGPSVARRVSAEVESAGRCILTSPRAEPHGSGIGASTWSEPWDRQP